MENFRKLRTKKVCRNPNTNTLSHDKRSRYETSEILHQRNLSCSRRNNTQQPENLFEIVLRRKGHLQKDSWELEQKSKNQIGFDDEAPKHNLQNALPV